MIYWDVLNLQLDMELLQGLHVLQMVAMTFWYSYRNEQKRFCKTLRIHQVTGVWTHIATVIC